MKKLLVPSYDEAYERFLSETASSLDLFVFNHEPAGIDDEILFRTQLQHVLDQAYEAGWNDSCEAPHLRIMMNEVNKCE